MPESKHLRIGISIGDINGIGPEVVLKTLADPRLTEICTPVVFASMNVLNYHRKTLKIGHFNVHQAKDLSQIKLRQVNLITCLDGEVKIQLGEVQKEAGKAALDSLSAACEALEAKEIDALVTAPIHKDSIQSEEFNFPGHTEYLGSRFQPGTPLMILAGTSCRVALVTGHVPVNQIAARISRESVIEKIKQFKAALIQDFGIRKPRIAVLGLNPHAGDGGLLGSEEKTCIEPAIQEAQKMDILAFGPYPADGFWANGQAKEFDGVLAMYHDQGLIPFKTLEFETGINFTAGLTIVRTSPDHGTGFDIAGKNVAHPDSFRHALYAAIDIYRQRSIQTELLTNQMVNLEAQKHQTKN